MNDVKVNTMLRIPASLHERLRKRAKREHRSLNTLVIVMLEQAEEAEDSDPQAYDETRAFACASP
jgi:hypothetical protein